MSINSYRAAVQRRLPRIGPRELFKLLGIALLVLAILQQLRRPPQQRTWYGRVFGFVPYDFRPPTPGRFLSRWWNPSDRRLFTEHAFGIGWSLNMAQATRLLARLLPYAD